MRRPDWKQALRDYIDAARHRPFAYGAQDCALFAAGGVRVLTGEDHAAAFGAYDQARARALLEQHGGVTGIATAVLGDAVPPNLCHDGDVVELATDAGPALGLCLGMNCVFAGRRGLVFRPRELIVRGWKVG